MIYFNPVTYTKFDLPESHAGISYKLEFRCIRSGVVCLTSNATGPRARSRDAMRDGRLVVRVENGEDAYGPGPWSTAELHLVGDLNAAELVYAVLLRDASFGVLADWIEDDANGRVKFSRSHWWQPHRLHEDAVYHFLYLLRLYRDERRELPRQKRARLKAERDARSESQ